MRKVMYITNFLGITKKYLVVGSGWNTKIIDISYELG